MSSLFFNFFLGCSVTQQEGGLRSRARLLGNKPNNCLGYVLQVELRWKMQVKSTPAGVLPG
jgi:hypothetical protein